MLMTGAPPSFSLGALADLPGHDSRTSARLRISDLNLDLVSSVQVRLPVPYVPPNPLTVNNCSSCGFRLR